MMRGWYAGFFALAVLALCAGGLFAFRRLESDANAATARAAWVPPRDSAALQRKFVPIAPDPGEYERFAAEDAAWRKQNARQYTVSELRARGDGRRSEQDLLHDRVYELSRRGNYARAIAELEQWLKRHPSDQRALLSLARLLNETGRNGEAIVRYRQLLEVKQRSGYE